MKQAFRHLDRRGVGMIRASDALRAVRGEVNTRRAQAIDEAFDTLLYDTENVAGSGNDGETLDPAVVARRFHADVHPNVVSGTKEPREVLSEFLEAFEGEATLPRLRSAGFAVLSYGWWRRFRSVSRRGIQVTCSRHPDF